MKKIIICIAGGSRGLGQALLNRFWTEGYTPVAFHRGNEIPDIINHKLDLSDKSSIDSSINILLRYLNNSELETVSIHFLSGGSRNIAELSNEERIQQVFWHNYILPTLITDKIFDFGETLGSIPDINLVYYSSAASQHLKGYPHYSSAKLALETYFKSKFSQSNGSLKMYLFRLGLVDIPHKYFHHLSVNNPIQFSEYLRDNIPSGYFMQPSDIADTVMKMSVNNLANNGSFCDLSGGNSWK